MSLNSRFADFVLGVSAATLFFLPVCDGLNKLNTYWVAYYRKVVDPTIEIAAFVDILVLAACFWGAMRLVRRLEPPGQRIARAIFLLSLVVPVSHLSALMAEGRMGLLKVVIRGAATIVNALLVWGAATAAIYDRRGIFRAAATVVRTLSPLFLIVFANAAWAHIRLPAASLRDGPLAERLPAFSSERPRVVWIIFDEFDYALTFCERPASVKMPEFDRLSRESVNATAARPPAGDTLDSVPSLLIGQRVNLAAPAGPRSLQMILRPKGKTIGWDSEPTIFQQVRAMGMNSGMVGWTHPVCRTIQGYLADCYWQPCVSEGSGINREGYAARVGLWRTMAYLFEEQMVRFPGAPASLSMHIRQTYERLAAEQKVIEYSDIREAALRMLADSRLDLAVTHWPVPHPRGIYSRYRLTFDTSGQANYLDNLALADAALGEIRRAMTQARLWDRTSILVTSDHPFRTGMWELTPEEAVATRGKQHPEVPFMLKLAGQTSGLIYSRKFNTVLAHDLSLALLRSELTNPDEVIRWLDRNRATASGQ